MSAAEALLEVGKIQASAALLAAFLAAPPPAASPASVPAAPVVPPPAAPAGFGLTDPAAFYKAIRSSDAVFGGTLTPGQFAGCEDDMRVGAGKLPLAWMAYCLATDYHESNHTMQPIHELGSGDGPDADKWDDYLQKYDTGRLAAALGNTPEADGDGIRWAGRGKPQITGHDNYQKADKRLHELGLLSPAESLMDTPDLALRPDIAAAMLVYGMAEGWFTGKKLNDFLPGVATFDQFVAARPIVNGTDRAALIAGYAVAFQSGLQLGIWK